VSNRRTVLYLSGSDVAEIFTMPLAIEAVKKAFMELSGGQVQVPLRMSLDIPQFQGVNLIKPVYSSAVNRIAVKVISLYRNNPLRNLPYSHALVFLLDGESGVPLAIMEGDHLTAMRTGAASGLATDLLAVKNATTAAIFGAGLQARKQLEAIIAVRQLSHIYIFDPNPDMINNFIRETKNKFGVTILPAQSDKILEKVQIICTATTSNQPVFSDRWIPAGVHINGIGSFRPDTREIPSETVSRARLVVDQREASLKEAGDIIIPIAEGKISENHIHAELGEIVSGSKSSRMKEEEVTVFKSVGNAIQDLYAAHAIYNQGRKRGMGIQLPLQ
jgi:ornithine cyclodeaminase/alanine dehydrogenase-like protein (mu-crystallin family)